MKLIAILGGVTTITLMFFYALIGVIFMHVAEHKPVDSSYCDAIQQIDGTLYCMAIMRSEDDNIMIVRGEE